MNKTTQINTANTKRKTTETNRTQTARNTQHRLDSARLTHHSVLIEDLDDDRGRFVLDLLHVAVEHDFVEDEHLVPRRTQGLVDHLEHRPSEIRSQNDHRSEGRLRQREPLCVSCCFGEAACRGCAVVTSQNNASWKIVRLPHRNAWNQQQLFDAGFYQMGLLSHPNSQRCVPS